MIWWIRAGGWWRASSIFCLGISSFGLWINVKEGDPRKYLKYAKVPFLRLQLSTFLRDVSLLWVKSIDEWTPRDRNMGVTPGPKELKAWPKWPSSNFSEHLNSGPRKKYTLRSRGSDLVRVSKNCGDSNVTRFTSRHKASESNKTSKDNKGLVEFYFEMWGWGKFSFLVLPFQKHFGRFLQISDSKTVSCYSLDSSNVW